MEDNYLIKEIELWMSGKIQKIEDVAKNNMKLKKNIFEMGTVKVESDGFLQERLLEILKQKKYLVFQQFKGGHNIVHTQDIDQILAIDTTELKFSSWSNYFTICVPYDLKLQKYKVEWFDDLESAELFIEAGGFNNE